MFQSTHPRGVRLFLPPLKGLKTIGVSIHAPARGATAAELNRHSYGFVSIHAPARGATRCVSASHTVTINGFNPRTREGCDIKPKMRLCEKCGFNPRTREGCDEIFVSPARLEVLFQSTHPRGVRPATQTASINKQKVSIHAPARGATCNRY